MAWHKEEEHSIMQTEICILVNFKWIEPMGMELIFTKMARDTKDNGKTIYRMEPVQKNLKMAQSTMVSSAMVKNMDTVYMNGLMDLNMKVNSTRIIFKDKELIDGLIKDNSLEIGRIIKCMVQAFLLGTMVENMKVNT